MSRVITVKELVAFLQHHGFACHNTVGSHRHYRHPTLETATVWTHGGRNAEVTETNLRAIRRQVGYSKDDVLQFLGR